MNFFRREWLERISSLLEVPAPDPEQLRRRIKSVERDVILPVKLFLVFGLIYFLYFTRWFDVPANALDIAIQNVKQFVLVYGIFNFATAPILMSVKRLPLALLQ